MTSADPALEIDDVRCLNPGTIGFLLEPALLTDDVLILVGILCPVPTLLPIEDVLSRTIK